MPHQCTNCGKTFDDGSKQMLSGCPECGGNKFQFQPSSAARSSDEPSDATESASSPQPVDPSPATDETSPAVDDESSDRGSVAETAAKARSSVREWVGNRTSDDSDETASGDAAGDTSNTDVSFPADDTSTAGAAESPSGADSSSPGGSSSTAESSPTADSSPTTDSPSTADPSSPTQPSTSQSASGSPAATESEDNAQASARSDVVTPEELSAARDEAQVETAQQPPAPDDADGTVIEPSSDDRPDLSELREELNDQFESIKILSPGQYELNLMELYDRDEYIISLREDGRYVIEVADSWKHDDDR